MSLDAKRRCLGRAALPILLTINSFGSCLASPRDTVPGIGTYELHGRVLPGGTCTGNQVLRPFKYLYFVGRTSGSTFYYLGAPGSDADTVALPPYPKPGQTWKGQITWSVNPVTFQPPSVATHFSLSLTEVDPRLIFLNGEIHIPTADGSECSENVGYTGVLVSGLD